MQILCQLLSVDADKVEVNVGKNVILRNSSGKNWTIPVNERGEYLINYRRNSSFSTLSFRSFADAWAHQRKIRLLCLPNAMLRAKHCLLAMAATGLTDLGPTPLQSQSPLVYTHLNVNNVLHNDYLSFVPWTWVVAGWCVVTWTTLFRMRKAIIIEAVLVPIAVVVLYTVLPSASFGPGACKSPLAWPVLSYGVVNFGAVVLRWREEQKGKQQIKLLFSRMLSPEVMNHLLDHPENVKLGGSERAATILFSDISNT